MALGLRIAHRAASDIERAERWWLENRPAAPGAFLADLRGAFILLLRQPGTGVKVGNARLQGVRRLHLGRIRYFVYYRVRDDELVVLSVWHSSGVVENRVSEFIMTPNPAFQRTGFGSR